MEWNRVKTILIAMLLVVDLILGYHVASQTWERRQTERQGMNYARQLLREAGGEFEDGAFDGLPQYRYVYTTPRDYQEEKKIALNLLPGAETEEPGGGVAIYQSEGGRLSFRNGGRLELELYHAEPAAGQSQADFYRGLLEDAGFPMEGAESETSQGTTRFYASTDDGRRIIGAELAFRQENGGVHMSGGWLFADSYEQGKRSRSRMELMQALAQIIRNEPVYRVIRSVSSVSVLESGQNGRMTLVPAWLVETGGGQLILNMVTKKLIAVT